jgi:polysaccharide export outer membrane protein
MSLRERNPLSSCPGLRALWVLCLLAAALAPAGAAQQPPPGVPPTAAPGSPLTLLGPGDGLGFQVYGQPDMGATVFVAEDGTIPVPLVGAVKVSGMSPAEAAKAVEKAFRKGKYLVNPIVIITVTQPRSQRVAVLGEVGTPGRYVIDSGTTIFDLLAEAGGVKETGSDTIYVLRTGPDGATERIAVDLKGMLATPETQAPVTLRAGDSIHVPRAEQVFVYGEVNAPNTYRLDPGMTVLEAIVRAGGLTSRGSDRSVEIRRHLDDGSYVTLTRKLSDRVEANDVIRVKERIF